MIKRKSKPIARIPRRASAAPVSLADHWDQGATGPANREGLDDQERGDMDMTTGKITNPNRVFGKTRMPVVMRYTRRGMITPELAAVALRLHAAWAGYPARDPLMAMGDRVDGGGNSDPNATRIDGRREFRAMWGKVPIRCRAVVEHVALLDLLISAMPGCSRAEAAAEALAHLVQGLESIGL